MSDFQDRHNKKKHRQHESISYYAFRFLLVLLLIIGIAILIKSVNKWDFSNQGGPPADSVTPTPEATPVPENPFADLTDSDVYTFLQGPVAWNSKTPWSGSWCEEVLAGQRFSVFCCGHCCMANIYSTLTTFDCSPVDMFDLAKETTDYAPNSEYGAIAWEYMQQALQTTGIYSTLREKDETYEEFQQSMKDGVTAICNVNSGDDNTYWQDVTGHYVNIWLYNSEDDTVFLADSGNPGHNRQRIPLRYVYDALKTSDVYQYMLVESVDPDGNTWGHNGIDWDWNPPW